MKWMREHMTISVALFLVLNLAVWGVFGASMKAAAPNPSAVVAVEIPPPPPPPPPPKPPVSVDTKATDDGKGVSMWFIPCPPPMPPSALDTFVRALWAYGPTLFTFLTGLALVVAKWGHVVRELMGKGTPPA